MHGHCLSSAWYVERMARARHPPSLYLAKCFRAEISTQQVVYLIFFFPFPFPSFHRPLPFFHRPLPPLSPQAPPKHAMTVISADDSVLQNFVSEHGKLLNGLPTLSYNSPSDRRFVHWTDIKNVFKDINYLKIGHQRVYFDIDDEHRL